MALEAPVPSEERPPQPGNWHVASCPRGDVGSLEPHKAALDIKYHKIN